MSAEPTATHPPGYPREFVRVGDQYYVITTSALAEDRTRVLKHGETFAIFDRFGDIQPLGTGEHGLYHRGTRFLSRQDLLFSRGRPLLLASHLEAENVALTIDLTNPELTEDGGPIVPRGSVHLMRSKLLWDGCCHERLLIYNYGERPAEVRLRLHFEADFADMFEIRGTARAQRGEFRPPRVGHGELSFSYLGRDGVERTTWIICDPTPVETHPDGFTIELTLDPREHRQYELGILCLVGEEEPRPLAPYAEVHQRSVQRIETLNAASCRIRASNENFNDWLDRSRADLNLLVTDTPLGLYPYAGTPWFSTPFGRDGIITALQLLWINPNIARGALHFLAHTQADRLDPRVDAEPGKIIHEVREGEMPATGEVPFARYYGSIDSTPLFLILAAEYLRATGDIELVNSIRGSLAAAVRWIDEFGDRDRDGFVEYLPNERGLINQGWKDANDSVFHEDGRLAEGAIALCEVQAYVYAARLAAAEIADALREPEFAAAQRRAAHELRRRFEEAFWDESMGLYVLALDGEKRACRVAASNAGQCLFSGIASAERAARVVEAMLSPRFFTGWGIRTVAAGQARYNPMSYHNGSVWPHDTAMIAWGMARYGFREACIRLLNGLFDAARFFDLQRLPELFCGFERRAGEGPIQYPLACAPQAWATGAVFLLLQSCLGLEVRGGTGELRFEQPRLPEWIEWLELTNLPVGGESIDVLLERSPHDVSISMLRRPQRSRVIAIK
jgi:glycogen debranching enzyme